MKTILTKILFLLTVSFCFLSLACVQSSVETVPSDTVQSSQIYRIYTIEADKTRTEIAAAFRIGGATGTTVELTAPAQVLYNNQAMPVSAPSNLIGTNYRMKGTDYRTFSGQYNSSHEFSYTDADGKNVVNAIKLAPLEISAKVSFTLENSKPVTIPLSRSIGNNETMTIAIDTIIDDEIPTANNSVYLSEKRDAIIVTPEYWQTKQLKPQAELQLKIKKSENIANGSPLGGSISAVYSAAPLIVNIVQPKKQTAKQSNTNAVPKAENIK